MLSVVVSAGVVDGAEVADVLTTSLPFGVAACGVDAVRVSACCAALATGAAICLPAAAIILLPLFLLRVISGS